MGSEKFNALRQHFTAARKDGRGINKYEGNPSTLKQDLGECLHEFMQEIAITRSGAKDEHDKDVKGRDIGFSEAVKHRFGADKKQFLESLGIYGHHTLADVAKIGGHNGAFNRATFVDVMKEYTSYSGSSLHNTSDFRAFRFLIPEIFLDIVRTNYLHQARYPNWTAASTFIGSRSVKAPRLINAGPKMAEIAEGADIPLGVVNVGEKSVTTKKYGVGVRLTNELLMETSIDMLEVVLPGVTSSMNVGEDIRAIDVLLNGEQADGSESAPIVGVDSIADGFKQIDIDTVVDQMRWLGQPANRMIMDFAEAKADLNSTTTNRERLKISTYSELPFDIWSLPADQMIYLDSTRAMGRLQFGSFAVEEEYSAKSQTNEIYFSFHSGFYIINRDARVVQDQSLDFATNGFPSYMDVSSYISNAGFATF